MPDNFNNRVATAASIISSGERPTRRFDSCFEMYDGDAVALALLLRTQKRPGTALARNLWRYLERSSIEALEAKHNPDGVTDLRALSAGMVARARARFAAGDAAR